MAYTVDSEWRNRSTFLKGREAIRDFLSDKWVREQEYRLIKEIWAHSDNRIAVRFCYEYHDDSGKWFRAHGENALNSTISILLPSMPNCIVPFVDFSVRQRELGIQHGWINDEKACIH